jgi:hypothetical protein
VDRSEAKQRQLNRAWPTRARSKPFDQLEGPTAGRWTGPHRQLADVPQGGAEGVIVGEGGRFYGYALYLVKGKPVFTYNLLDLQLFGFDCHDVGRDGIGGVENARLVAGRA